MADMNLALASSVDLDAVRKNNDRIENLSDVVRSMVKTFVNEACGELDSYMSQIDKILTNDEGAPVSDDELEDFIREHFCQAQQGKNIHLHIGDARDIIPQVGGKFDLVFMDANKRQYLEYYNLVFDYVNPDGFIIADNTLWDGKVVDYGKKLDAQTAGILEFNDFVAADERVEKVIIPLRDGLTIIHKLPL